MADNRPRDSRGRWLRYSLAIAAGAACVIVGLNGFPWYWLVFACLCTVWLACGSRAIFRPGVTRVDDALICRYLPWFEANAYVLNVFFPVMGICMISARQDPQAPMWFPFFGWLLVALIPLFVYATVRMRIRSELIVGPHHLVLRMPAPKEGDREIQRDEVTGIELVTRSAGGRNGLPQVALAYQVDDKRQEQVTFGNALTVQPRCLLAALVVWQEGSADDPGLLHRVEAALRGFRVTRA